MRRARRSSLAGLMLLATIAAAPGAPRSGAEPIGARASNARDVRQAAQAAALDRRIAAALARHRSADASAAATARQGARQAARTRSLRTALKKIETTRETAERAARETVARAEHEKQPVEASAARARQSALSLSSGSLSANARARAQLTRPVLGHLVHGWGEPTEGGPATGLSYQAAPAARVVAPCGGRVAFADVFRSYGHLLILDCGGGYHTVLAGFDRLDVRVGHTVQAGETVGTMPAWDSAAGGHRALLYVELRHGGQPVNPAPWIKPAR